MKKTIAIVYIILTISIMLAAASWFTWGNACQYTNLIPEGKSYGGMCVGDGMQFVGVFAFCLVVAAVYLVVTTLVLRALGFKLTKK